MMPMRPSEKRPVGGESAAVDTIGRPPLEELAAPLGEGMLVNQVGPVKYTSAGPAVCVRTVADESAER